MIMYRWLNLVSCIICIFMVYYHIGVPDQCHFRRTGLLQKDRQDQKDKNKKINKKMVLSG